MESLQGETEGVGSVKRLQRDVMHVSEDVTPCQGKFTESGILGKFFRFRYWEMIVID